MVNILPKKAQNELVTAYYTRLAATFFLLAAGVVLVGGALLAPSYILLSDSAAAAERFTQALNQTLSLKSKAGDASALPTLTEETTLVRQLTRPPQFPALISGILTAKSKNITLGKINLVFKDAGAGTVELSGTAATRETLVGFVDALKKNPAFAAASVPVQNLAGGTDIPFVLSFPYKLQ